MVWVGALELKDCPAGFSGNSKPGPNTPTAGTTKQQGFLVGGIPTPSEKYESVGMMTFPIYGTIKKIH